jgi:hypothetical protein
MLAETDGVVWSVSKSGEVMKVNAGSNDWSNVCSIGELTELHGVVGVGDSIVVFGKGELPAEPFAAIVNGRQPHQAIAGLRGSACRVVRLDLQSRPWFLASGLYRLNDDATAVRVPVVTK